MWMVAYVAQTKKQAERIRDFLEGAGILVKIRSVNQSENEEIGCFEIMVPESELSEAHSTIISKLF
ncbi:MAG: hypothetical protein IKL09_08855 [Clostridia bacterium]|nr:hypothetical protein [Clostridia bacterium]